jgi:hypothetical protein
MSIAKKDMHNDQLGRHVESLPWCVSAFLTGSKEDICGGHAAPQ